MVLEEHKSAVGRGAPIFGEIVGFVVFLLFSSILFSISYGMGSDAHHITLGREDGKGPEIAIQSALDCAGVGMEEVGYANCHATSTPLGDEIELNCLARITAKTSSNLAISSSKGHTGHLLGASGAVEAIFTVLGLLHSLFPPTLNLKNPSFETSSNPHLQLMKSEISHPLSFTSQHDSFVKLDHIRNDGSIIPERDDLEEVGLNFDSGTMKDSSISHALSNSFGFGGTNCSLLFRKYCNK